MSSVPFRRPSAKSRPFLVPKGPVTNARRSPLVWWHLLSLDAPTVAATWTVFIAWSAGIRISVVDPLAMFLAVWLLYAADRLLDGRRLLQGQHQPGLEERHHFHHVHRTRFLGVMIAMIAPLVWLLHALNTAVLNLYIVLAALLSAWLLLIHARPASDSSAADRLPKELAVGAFFPAAVFIPTVARVPTLRMALLPLALAFACVCTLNCLFLFAWEHPLQRSQAHCSTLWGARHLKSLSFSAIGLIAVLCLRTCLQPGHPWHRALPFFVACGASVSLLLGLHRLRHRFARNAVRALADAALLSPLPFWLGVQIVRHHG